MSAIGVMTNQTALCVSFDNSVWLKTQDEELRERFGRAVDSALDYQRRAKSTLEEIRAVWIGRRIIVSAEDHSRDRFTSLKLRFDDGRQISIESEEWPTENVKLWTEASLHLRVPHIVDRRY